MNIITDVESKDFAEAMLKLRGFEQIEEIPRERDIFERFVIRDYDKNTPRLVTKFELPSEPDENGCYKLIPKTYTRNFMRRVESLWVLRSGFNVPKYTIHHNYTWAPAHHKMPISSSVYENKNPGYHDTSQYCVVETIYLDDGGSQ